MRKFLTAFLATTLVILFLYSHFRTSQYREAINREAAIKTLAAHKLEREQTTAERLELVVAMENNLPGHFTHKGNSYGMQYDLVRRYADYLDVELKVVSVNSFKSINRGFEDNTIDMAISIAGKSQFLGAKQLHMLSSIDGGYVVVAGNNAPKCENIEQLRNYTSGREVALSKSFYNSEEYAMWVDSVKSIALVSSCSTEKMINKLKKGNFDLLVCNKEQARLAMMRVKGLSMIYEFTNDIKSSIYVSQKEKDLGASFDIWYNKFITGDEFKRLVYLYEGDNFYKEIQLYGYIERKDQLSPYDNLIKGIAEREGRDWRLISAIAYSESRFNPDVVSKSGAIGLMQIMPQTAKIFGVNVEDAEDPVVNIEVALKLLAEIEKVFKFPMSVPESDRLKITLAAYNCGVGYVLDARKVARKYGEDHNSWDVILKYLYYRGADDHLITKRGALKSKETVNYVNEVMDKYSSYQLKSTLVGKL